MGSGLYANDRAMNARDKINEVKFSLNTNCGTFMSSSLQDHHELNKNAGHDYLQSSLDAQRAAYLLQPYPDREQRIKDLQALKQLLKDNQEAIVTAINQDYGNRARQETILAEFIVVLDGINFAIKHLKKWMKPQRRKIEFTLYPGAKNRVIPQPLGVVGVIVPWNFPIQLSFTPLTCIFAAGNRAMVKMSENSIHLSRLLIKLCADYFPPEKLAFFEETGGVGIEFSKLPFDHLLFTGSGATGKAVMAAAAKNLTPVTLELGGKSPAVIATDYPLPKAVERIMAAKLFNAGQVCVNVDYVFVHESQLDEFVSLAKTWVAAHCPDIESDDYSSIIDDKSWQRIMQAAEDAEQRGATLINLSNGQAASSDSRKIPPQLILNATEDMQVLQREIFGPLLPVIPYQNKEAVVSYISAKDRPLAFYPFTGDKDLQEFYLNHVMSGGVCVNDALIHPGQHDLPFGGVGASGMGHYHGYEGFTNFSKLRPVFYQAGFSSLKFLAPPYGKLANTMLNTIMKLKK
jgi:coniferyl-aldehyde dehydrogenase